MVRRTTVMRAVAGLCAIGVGAFTFYTGMYRPQRLDDIALQGYAEIDAWAQGTPVHGPLWSGESTCGIGFFPHHPLLASYLSYGVVQLGADVTMTQYGGLAIATAALLLVLAWVAPWPSIVVGAAIAGALYLAPGYHEWLAAPIEHTWSITCMYLLAIVCLLRRPLWPLALMCFVTAWFSIDLVFLHAATVAGVLVAAHGITWRVIIAGLAGIATYTLGFVLHLVQVWCHHAWNYDAAYADYFTNPSSSLMCRVRTLTMAERWQSVKDIFPAYAHEVFHNERGQWTGAGFWFVIMLCLALQPVSRRGALGVVLFLALVCSVQVVAPGLLPPHLHYLVRYVILLPIGALIVLAAGEAKWQRQ